MFRSIIKRVSGPASIVAAMSIMQAVRASSSSPTVCEPSKDYKMAYRMLGDTGLQVSVLSYGFWATFGAKSDLKNDDGVVAAKACLQTARDYGVNLFDNAEGK
jgi:hypothetical protein